MSSGSLTSFKIDKKMAETLQELKNSTNAASKAEVLRRAVALFELVQDGKKNGSVVQLVDVDDSGRESNKRQIVLP